MGDGVQTLVWADGLNSQTKVWTPFEVPVFLRKTGTSKTYHPNERTTKKATPQIKSISVRFYDKSMS